MRIDGPQITGSFNLNGDTVADLDIFATTSSLNNLTSSVATTGSNLFKGTQTISGSIIPAVDNTYDLGSLTHQFRDLYLSSASLYIDGTKVLSSTTQELQITTDAGQSFKILEAGSDTITLQSADGNITLATSGGGDVIMDPTNGVIGLKGTVTIYTGNKITSSDGNSIQFGNGIAVTGSIVSTTTSLVSGSSQITYSGLSGIPSDIISGSGQLTTLGIATTGSNTFNGNLTVTGFIDTQELRTTYISSSILYRSGSTKFGDELTDTHSFTGSILISGSISVPGSNLVSGSSQVLNGSGVFSGSAQLPSGIVSGSAQTIANLPSGTVSGSSQILNGTGFVKTSGASITYDNSTYLTTGTASSTYQTIITNPVTGTGTTNYLPKFTGASTIGNSNLINDASGNLGLGVTPSAWGTSSGYIAFQIGSSGLYGRAAAANETYLTSNCFYDASWKYIYSARSTRYDQVDGTHAWYIAPSGTAGNAISFTQAMTLTAAGRLLLGTATEGSYQLDINANGYRTFRIQANDDVIMTIGSTIASSQNWTFGATANGSGQGGNLFFIGTSTNNPSGILTKNFYIQSTGAATFSSSVTAGTDGVYGNNRTANNGGGTVLNIMGSSSSSTSSQLNLTQVWNGVQYPIVLKNIYNPVGGAASSIFTLSTTQWNGSAAITTERFRVDGNDGIITIGDTLGYTTAQKGQFFSKGGGSMFTANLLSGGFGRHFTMQRNDSTKWHIGVDGSDNFGIMDSADSFIMTLTGGGVMTANTFKSNVTPGSPTLDSAGSFVTLANGGFVDFPAMSGMIIVNNTGTGAVQVFICGGGNTASLGAVVNVTGTMTHSPGVGGYRFTNNTGSSWAFAFQVFKTRGTA